MLALGIRRRHDEIDQRTRDGYLPRRNGPAGHQLLGLADDDAIRVMRGLRDGKGIQGDRFVLVRAVAILVN